MNRIASWLAGITLCMLGGTSLAADLPAVLVEQGGHGARDQCTTEKEDEYTKDDQYREQGLEDPGQRMVVCLR